MHILTGTVSLGNPCTVHASHDHCTNMPPTCARGRQMGLQLNVEGETPLPCNQPPHRQRPRRAAQAVPLLNWYREHLLEKLAELDPSKQRQLRGIKARKTTIIKALEDLGFYPSSHHGSHQMEGPENEDEQQQVAFAKMRYSNRNNNNYN